SVEPGAGDPILILALVVVVIGGIGSVRGALVGALMVGIFDTLSRVLIPLVIQTDAAFSGHFPNRPEQVRKRLKLLAFSRLFLLVLTAPGRLFFILSRPPRALAVPSQQYVHLLFAGVR